MLAVLNVLMKGFVATILTPRVISSGGTMGGGGAMAPPSKIQKTFLPGSIWANLFFARKKGTLLSRKGYKTIMV
jgi:hypothetical protein